MAANLLFAVCLAAQVFGIAWFLIRPLTPQFLAIHHLPAAHDWVKLGHLPTPPVRAYWPFAAGSFGTALWLWQRGRRPSMWLLVVGAVVLSLLALLVPPFQSLDVYTYSFYGRAQAVFHENPYLTIPNLHRADPWYPFWDWRSWSAVYGPPFLLFLRGVAVLAGPSMLAWVIWMKLLLTAATGGAVALLACALRGDGDPRWPVLLVGCNPLVLESVAMSAHVDALLLLLAAGAIFAHRHRWFLAAFGLLVGMMLIKIYFGPLVVLYALWWTAQQPPGQRLRSLARLGAAAVTLVVLAYLPFASARTGVLHSVLRAGLEFASGTAANVLRRILALVLVGLGVGARSAGRLSAWIARDLSLIAIVVGFVAVALRLPRAKQPWTGLAAYFLVALLATPYVHFWYVLPLLALVAVAPGGPPTVAAAAWSIAQLSRSVGFPAVGPYVLTRTQITWVVDRLGPSWRGLTGAVVAFLGAYAPPLLALLWVQIRRTPVNAGVRAEAPRDAPRPDDAEPVPR
jgi:hypothetical protein